MESLAGQLVVVTGPSGAGKSTVSRLIAGAMGRGVHLPIDDFESFVVAGRAEPSGSDAQDRAVGGAVFAAGLQFAFGGFGVVVDGFVFPEVLVELSGWIESNGVCLHYAVLRPDIATCTARARARRPGDAFDNESFARLHDRFGHLGEYDTHVVDHSGPPESIADRIVASLQTGQLRLSSG